MTVWDGMFKGKTIEDVPYVLAHIYDLLAANLISPRLQIASRLLANSAAYDEYVPPGHPEDELACLCGSKLRNALAWADALIAAAAATEGK